jgi:hypothetical protein
MEKLDRLGWTAGITISIQGVRIGIRANDEWVLSRVIEYLPRGWRAAKSPVADTIFSISGHENPAGSRVRRFNLLFCGAERSARTMDFQELLDSFAGSLHRYLAWASRSRMFFRAGVVGWNGHAIVIPGKGMAGKTTLVSAFVEAGATYYSDEYAVLDRTGRVHPYSLGALNRPEESASSGRVPAATFGWSVGKRPLPVGLILLSHYRKGARFKPRSLGSGEAVLSLLQYGLTPLRRPKEDFSLLAAVTSRAVVLQGVRGEAGRAAEAVLSLMQKQWPTLATA